MTPIENTEIVFLPGTTFGARCVVENAFQCLPYDDRVFLAEKDHHLIFGTHLDHAHPMGKYNFWEPTPYDDRVHQNQMCGLYIGYMNRTVIAECKLRKGASTSERIEWDEAEILPESRWEREELAYLSWIVPHEVGHAFDDKAGMPSTWPGFRAAWAADIAALGGVKGAHEKGLDYFVQYGLDGRGPEEAFAEIYAAIVPQQYGQGVKVNADYQNNTCITNMFFIPTHGVRAAFKKMRTAKITRKEARDHEKIAALHKDCAKNITESFPHATAWVREFHDAFTEACKMGPAYRDQFIETRWKQDMRNHGLECDDIIVDTEYVAAAQRPNTGASRGCYLPPSRLQF